MSAVIYIEGGGDSKDLRARCREGFRKLLNKCDLQGRMPKLVACGSRNGTFDDFKTAHSNNSGETFVAMLIDSEDPLDDIGATWDHLASRDGWKKPTDAHDEQALLMVTCMETWIVGDRNALSSHYGNGFQESALPSTDNLESRLRDKVQDALLHASRNCSNKYSKGKHSFEVLAKLTPTVLQEKLPSFKRSLRILLKRC